MKENLKPVTNSNILVVDDNIGNLRLLTAILKNQKYIIRTAIDGAMALKSVRANPPDLILLDIMMPEPNGHEVCRQLKADEKTEEIPIIFISALTDILEVVKSFTLGGVDYITKPFHEEEVVARVQTHLNVRNLQKRLKEKNDQLQKALDEVKTLRGIIPICASCKKIRDDKGAWKQVEAYVATHSYASFTHSLCEECSEELYGDQEWYKNRGDYNEESDLS